MANEKHLYLTATGDYASSAAPFANESWQTGIRLALTFAAEEPPTVGTLQNTWSPSASIINLDETNWTISGNWTVIGPGFAELNPGAFLNAVAGPAWKTWMQTTDCFSNAVRLRELRLYPIGPDGRAVAAPPFAAGSPAVLTYKSTYPTGVVSTALLPPQLTVAASLRTPQVGRRGRGRMFGPALGAGQVSQGTLQSTPKTALLAAYVALLEALAGGSSPENDQWLRPSVIGAPWSSYATINEVRVDNIVDTQRRRRRSAISTWSSASVSYS